MDYSALYPEILPDCPGVPFPVAQRAIREAVRTFCKKSSAYRHTVLPTELSYLNGTYTIAIPTGTQIESIVSPIVLSGDYSNGALSSVITTLGTPSTSVHVDDIRGFQYTLVNLVMMAVTPTNTITIKIGSNYYVLTGATADVTNVSTTVGGISGTVTLTTSVTVADGTAGNAIVGPGDSYSISTSELQGAAPEWMDINHPGWRNWQDYSDGAFFVMQSTNTFKLAPDSGTDRHNNLTITLVLMPDRTTTTIPDEFGNRWFDYLTSGAKYLLTAMPAAKWTQPQLSAFHLQKFESGIKEAERYIKTAYRQPGKDGIRRVTYYGK